MATSSSVRLERSLAVPGGPLGTAGHSIYARQLWIGWATAMEIMEGRG